MSSPTCPSGKRTLLILLIGILFHWILNNFPLLWKTLLFVLRIFMPILAGVVITIILSVFVDLFEEHLLKNPRFQRFRRPLAVLLSVVSFFLLLFVIGAILLPRIAATIQGLSYRIPDFIVSLQSFLQRLITRFPVISQWLNPSSMNYEALLQKALQTVGRLLPGTLGSTLQLTSSILSFLYTFIIGFIFAIYFLLQREQILDQTQRILYAYTSERTTKRFNRVFRLVESSFKNFVTGQFLEAIICGSLTWLAMSLFQIPEKLLVSFIIGVTALIPMFGAIFGTVLGALLVLIVNPMKALLFVVVVIIVIQVDGNLIYPRVVGNKMGTPALLILAAVIVGGNLLGFTGMILSVPLASVFYTLLKESIDHRLSEKALQPPAPETES